MYQHVLFSDVKIVMVYLCAAFFAHAQRTQSQACGTQGLRSAEKAA